MDYKIEKNIEFPNNQKKKQSKYPFDKMEVGDSFFADCSKSCLLSASYAWCRRTGNTSRVFKTAIDGDGSRIWRLK